MDVVLGVERVQQLHAAVLELPGVLHARVEAEGHGSAEGEGRIDADIVVGCGVAGLDRAVTHRLHRLQAGNDFAGGEDLNLELVVAHFGDGLREHLGGAVDGVERLREGRGQAPLHFRGGLRDRRGGDSGGSGGNRCRLDERAALHEQILPKSRNWWRFRSVVGLVGAERTTFPCCMPALPNGSVPISAYIRVGP
jgi:hypothetical protein